MGIGGISIWQLLIMFLIFALFILPMVHVLISRRSHGGAKAGWFLAVFFFSIIAYIPFLIVTQGRLDEIKASDGNRA